jgi:hypothetical protein
VIQVYLESSPVKYLAKFGFYNNTNTKLKCEEHAITEAVSSPSVFLNFSTKKAGTFIAIINGIRTLTFSRML